MQVRRLWLQDFRSYSELDLELPDGLTVVVGDNGNGKTNLVEALVFLATAKSFRGVSSDAMVRRGAERAVVRAEIRADDRDVLVEAEIPLEGRQRILVNRQRLNRARDLAGVMAATVFSPDDLDIVKGGPAVRRDFLDDLLVSLHPKNRGAIEDFERTLRQRNALLRQVAGRLRPEDELSLDVWDDRFARTGERLGGLRRKVAEQLGPSVRDAYHEVAGAAPEVSSAYEASWAGDGLDVSLGRSRPDDVRRGASTVGPHRDDLVVLLSGMPSRTHASQGEQRSLVLALRLAAHRLVIEARSDTPLLVLDDVFSELDDRRASALIDALPRGQTVMTTAVALPSGARPDRVVRIEHSRVAD